MTDTAPKQKRKLGKGNLENPCRLGSRRYGPARVTPQPKGGRQNRVDDDAPFGLAQEPVLETALLRVVVEFPHLLGDRKHRFLERVLGFLGG
jgi:hypothetical protein